MAIFRCYFSYSWLSRGYLVANRGYFVAIMIKIIAVAIFQRGYFHFSYDLPIQRDMKIATKSVEHGSQNPRKTHMEIATGSCLLGQARPAHDKPPVWVGRAGTDFFIKIYFWIGTRHRTLRFFSAHDPPILKKSVF